jgi:hypothetical protein
MLSKEQEFDEAEVNSNFKYRIGKPALEQMPETTIMRLTRQGPRTLDSDDDRPIFSSVAKLVDGLSRRPYIDHRIKNSGAGTRPRPAPRDQVRGAISETRESFSSRLSKRTEGVFSTRRSTMAQNATARIVQSGIDPDGERADVIAHCRVDSIGKDCD